MARYKNWNSIRRAGPTPRYQPGSSQKSSHASRTSGDSWEDDSYSEQESLARRGISRNSWAASCSNDPIHISAREDAGSGWSAGEETPSEHSDDTGADSGFCDAPATEASAQDPSPNFRFSLGTTTLAAAAIASIAALSLYGNTSYPASLVPTRDTVASAFRDGLFSNRTSVYPYPSNASILEDTLIPLARSTCNAFSASPTWAKCTATAGVAYLARDIPARMSHELHDAEMGKLIGKTNLLESRLAGVQLLVKPDPEPKSSWWSRR